MQNILRFTLKLKKETDHFAAETINQQEIEGRVDSDMISVCKEHRLQPFLTLPLSLSVGDMLVERQLRVQDQTDILEVVLKRKGITDPMNRIETKNTSTSSIYGLTLLKVDV